MENFALAVGNTFVWHEVYAPDADAAVSFYTEALGFGSQTMEMGDIGSYTMLTKNGVPVAGVQSTSQPHMDGVPPHWATYLAVDNVDEKLEDCTAMGATIVVPPMDIPTVGRMALIADPQGAHIWLFTPNPEQANG